MTPKEVNPELEDTTLNSEQNRVLRDVLWYAANPSTTFQSFAWEDVDLYTESDTLAGDKDIFDGLVELGYFELNDKSMYEFTDKCMALFAANLVESE